MATILQTALWQQTSSRVRNVAGTETARHVEPEHAIDEDGGQQRGPLQLVDPLPDWAPRGDWFAPAELDLDNGT